ncbi:MAG: AmmeMemoRadiSam system protein A [Acidimicrobiales bacterium]|nr:AmmeMemoRadiSam system protein A [Acidimicrobiales bacterium]
MTDAVEPTTLSSADGDALVRLAAMAVATWVRSGGATSPDARTAPAAVSGPGACFVTLRADGQLRGCIGSLVPHRPLVDDVVANAVAAASRDPRFSPVTASELSRLHIEVSVLEPEQPVSARSFEELLALVRPGTDGLTVRAGGHRATLLPAVWEQLPDVDRFLDALWRKAGLRPGSWPSGIEVCRYATVSFGADLSEALAAQP